MGKPGIDKPGTLSPLARNVSSDIKYYVTDHLHSTGIFADKSGAVLDDNDFYPWGGVVPGVGQTTSNNTIKFTGQYRDGESQLDYFGARYYSNITGRFMSPDWAAKPVTVPYANFGDPQTLNLFSYVGNSPIIRTDAVGHAYAMFDTRVSGGGNADALPIDNTMDLEDALAALLWPQIYDPGPSKAPGKSASDASQGSTSNNRDSGTKSGSTFWQKLGNVVTGNGWKSNAEVIESQRQWLIDHGAVQVDDNGKATNMNWSKASAKQVTEAYRYLKAVEVAAQGNHLMASLGFAAAVTFKSQHGWRHLEGAGLNESEVQAAITEDVNAAIKNATQPPTNFWGRVTVNGRIIEYRAYTLPDGTINVGTTYFAKP